MKSESVRIDEGKAMQLHEIADQIDNLSVRWMVNRGVELFLAQEAPVYLSKSKEIAAILNRKHLKSAATDS